MTRPSRVLILGGGGPIGRRIARSILDRGGDVIALGRSTTPGLDVRDGDAVRAALSGQRIDTLHYLVNRGPVDATSARDAVHDFERVLDIACERGVKRAVVASSAAVYGESGRHARVETDALLGSSAYAQEKIGLEKALQAAGDRGLSGVALRVFNVYGPGLVNSLVNRLVGGRDRPAVRLSDRFVRDYVHVDDVARAFEFAAADDESVYAVLNVGSGRGVSNLELVSYVPSVAYVVDDSSFETTISVADISRARARWGFEPRVRLEDALTDPDRWIARA